MSLGRRAASSAKDPWLLLAAGVGGGLAWAVGLAAAPAVAIGAGMYGVGALVGALTNRDEDEPVYDDSEPVIEIRSGTPQAKLVGNLTAYLKDLRSFRAGDQPDSVVDSAITAVVAAEGAKQTALRVAAAVDGLDEALQRSRGTEAASQGARQAVERMMQRRQALLEKLQGTVGSVAEVYTKLLEMSATVSALDVEDHATTEVDSVNASLDSLRTTLAELESERRAQG